MNAEHCARTRAVQDLAARRVLAMTEDERLTMLLELFTEGAREMCLTDTDLLVELYPHKEMA